MVASKMKFATFFVFGVLLPHTGINGDLDKRILVNDVNVHQLQADMQSMKAQIAEIQSIKAQIAEIQSIKAQIVQMKSKKADIANIQPMKAEIADIQPMKAEIDVFKREMATLKQTIQQLTSSASVGAVYTRWGRLDCTGNRTTLVYSGFAAGGDYSTYGSAAEYVCLPHNPDFNMGEKAQPPHGYKTYIYGAEYEDNVFGQAIFEKDVPCAVCLSGMASNILMIPGKSSCISGWSKEYNGRLAVQASSNSLFKAAGQYVCVDHDAQTLEGGFQDNGGKLFYPVHAFCGSLRCPPFVQGELLTCVVCSK